MTGQVNTGDWGFTNSDENFQAVLAWKAAAIADGWSHEPTYKNHEGEDRACSLKKQGWHASVISRIHQGRKCRYEAAISVWGPDHLQIRVPNIYNWQELQDALKRCHHCGASPVDTFRIAFAGRGCKECADKANANLPRNWAN